MALAARERLLVFEVFDIPTHDFIQEVWGAIGVDSTLQLLTAATARQAIDDLLNLLDVDSEARLQEILAEWDEVSMDEVELAEAEGVKGVVSSARDKRSLIRTRAQVYVPFFREGELREKDEQWRSGGNRIRRG